MNFRKLMTDRRMLFLIILIALALILVAFRGVNFGIEFVGGTRIPITLEQPVDQATMSEIMNNIKNRVSTFGLKQVVVKSIGESEIYIELPQSEPGLVNNTINILSRQGKFEGIVDGKVAVSDESIMPAGIQAPAPYLQGNQVRWEVQFGLTEEGAVHFMETVRGKAQYPVYLFLDRPGESILLMTKAEVLGNSTLTEAEALEVLNDVLRKDNTTIPLLIIDNWADSKAQLGAMNRSVYNKTIISEAADPAKLADLQSMGFEVVKKPAADMVPQYSSGEEKAYIGDWKAIGLLSAPLLSADITGGAQERAQRFYTINGGAPAGLSQEAQFDYANNEVKVLKSILKGGALPVHIIIGTPTTIPAPLGSEFLKYSFIAAVIVILLVVTFVSLRYRNPKIVLPIFATNASELLLQVCILGALGTIDLGTMAGIIGALGTGLDAQILIADELLAQKAQGLTKKRRLENAFYIIMMNATIAIIAMVPLLFFSGLIEIIGFALATILGTFIGALITRPAYAAMVEHSLGISETNE